MLLDTQSLNIGLNEAKQDYFQIAIQEGKPYASPVRIEDATPVFYLSAPVYGRFRSQLEGVLRVQYHADVLQALITEQNDLLGTGSGAALLDENHLNLAHGLTPDKRFESVSTSDVLGQFLQSGQLSFSLLGENGETYQIVQKKLDNDWIVLFYQPQNAFLAAAQTLQNTNISLMILITCIVSAVGIWVARLFTKPIIHLTEVAQKVGEEI